MLYQTLMRHRRNAYLPWSVLLFLVAFAILLVVVSVAYLLPAFEAARGATPQERGYLSAYSALLLAIVLFVLLVMLLGALRIRRWFLPKDNPATRTRTEYTDAWAEAGRRAKGEE